MKNSSPHPLFLGLDFGSAFTRICYGRARNGRLEGISHLDYYGTPSHPSGVAHDAERESWLSGMAWESGLCSSTPLQLFPDPHGALRAAIDPKNTGSTGWHDHPAFEATRRLFFRLTGDVLEVERATGSGGAALALALDTPQSVKSAFKAAIALPELKFISTPEAVLLGYEMAARLDERLRIVAIFDAGAGGCRCTLLEVRLRQGLMSSEIVADFQDPHLGGNLLDRKLFNRIHLKNAGLQRVLAQLEGEERAAAMEEALWQIRALRVRLLDNSEARGEINLARCEGVPLKLSRDVLDSVVEDVTLSAARVLEGALQQAGISAHKIAYLLPVGGLTRLSGIQKMLALRVPQVETSAAHLANATDLLAPARGALRFAALDEGHAGDVRLVPLQSPAFGVALDGKLDPILPLNSPYPLRRSKIYASKEAVAGGVRFEIWSSFGRGLNGAGKVGEVALEFKGERWDFDTLPLRVSLELLAPGHLKAEVQPLDPNDPSRVSEVFREVRPGTWQKS